jgi:hypothetical protein
MQLDVEDNVDILTGMPEKKIAAILREFGQGDIKQVQRGRDVFEAISKGKPASSLIKENIEGLTGPAPATAAP